MHEFISHPGFKLIENQITILIQKQNELDAQLLKSAKILADKVVDVTQNELLKKVFTSDCYRIPDTRTNAIKQNAPLLEKLFAEAIIGSQRNYKKSEGTFFLKIDDLSKEGHYPEQRYHHIKQALKDAVNEFNIQAKTFLSFEGIYQRPQTHDYVSVEYTCDYKAEFPWK